METHSQEPSPLEEDNSSALLLSSDNPGYPGTAGHHHDSCHHPGPQSARDGVVSAVQRVWELQERD